MGTVIHMSEVEGRKFLARIGKRFLSSDEIREVGLCAVANELIRAVRDEFEADENPAEPRAEEV